MFPQIDLTPLIYLAAFGLIVIILLMLATPATLVWLGWTKTGIAFGAVLVGAIGSNAYGEWKKRL